MKKTEEKARQLDSGKCSVCQGTGWEIFTEKVEGYTEPIEFTRVRLQAKKYPNISNTLKRGLVEIVETCRDCQKCQTIKRGHQNSDTLRDANKC